jgi:hypothetical protein
MSGFLPVIPLRGAAMFQLGHEPEDEKAEGQNGKKSVENRQRIKVALHQGASERRDYFPP